MRLYEPLRPRYPNLDLHTLMIGRVSTPEQNESNIEAGYRYVEETLSQNYDGVPVIKYLGEQCSGMIVERETILEAIDEINTGKWDVVMMEDVSKSYRNPRWIYAFVQDCYDDGVRVIAPGDNVDTADPNWENALASAVFRHGSHIPDTRRRVRRTAVDTFHKGGMVLRHRAFYRKLNAEEAATGTFGPVGLKLAKLPEWTPTVMEMRRRVLANESYESIADWLTSEGVPTGPYVKRDDWCGRLVVSLLRDPILSGLRQFKKQNYVPIFRTGKHRRERNETPEEESYACLAHMTVEEQDELIAFMDGKADESTQPSGEDSRLKGRPRNHAPWPAQHAICGVCGSAVHQMGETIFKCSQAFAKGDARCWCHVQSNPDTIRMKLLPLLLRRLQEFPSFQNTLVDAAWLEYQAAMQAERDRDRGLTHRIKKLREEEANILTAIKAGGGKIPSLVTDLKRTTEEIAVLQAEHATPAESPFGKLEHRGDLIENLDLAVIELSRTSIPFGDLLRKIAMLRIVPVQALDTAQVRPRAKLKASICDDAGEPVEFEITVDLFDPPLHIKHAAECARVKSANPDWTLSRVGEDVGTQKMTVKRALAYAKLMADAGTNDPYRELTEQPKTASRWKKRAA